MLLFLLFFAVALAWPQDTLPVAGLAYDVTTGKPIAGVQIRLSPVVMGMNVLPPPPYGAVSQENGVFSNLAVKPGDYLILPFHRTYCYDLLTPREPETKPLITLRTGAPPEPLRIPMAPCAIVTGRILDDKSNPMPDVFLQPQLPPTSMQLLPPILQTLIPAGVRTNDDGEFRFRFPPGKFYLVAYASFRPAVRVDRPGEGAPQNTYYPSAPDLKSATPLETTAGAELSGIDIVLRRRPVLAIRGTITNSASPNLAVEIFGKTMSMSQMQPGRRDFAFTGLEPGEYHIRAIDYGSPPGRQSAPSSRSYSPFTRVLLQDHDEENISLTIVPPISLTGRIEPWPDSLPPKDRTLLFQPRTVSHSIGFLPPLECPLDATGRFSCTGLAPMRYRLALPSDLAESSFPKSIQLDGTPLPSTIVDFSTAATTATLKFSLGRGATVTGRVLVPTGRSLSQQTRIVALPDGETTLPNGSSGIEIAADGTYLVSGLAPGKYSIIAMDPLSYRGNSNEEILKMMLATATTVVVAEAQTLTGKDVTVASANPKPPSTPNPGAAANVP